MTELRQRREPIRSRKLLGSAKGQPCTLEFVGVCSHDPETTVSAHVHDDTFGMAMKADDFATVHACDRCHMFMDQGGWIGEISQAVLLRHILRAIFRTMRNRVERGLIVIPRDPERLSHDKPIRPREAPADRKKIPAREAEWPSRKMQSRPFQRKAK